MLKRLTERSLRKKQVIELKTEVRKPICAGDTPRANKSKKFLKFNLDIDLNN